MPSLSLRTEAIDLFTDRARHARPEFAVTDDNAAVVAEICARLDGLPLAIELAAARVRALSLAEILDSLHDRFRLLTGGARTAVRRQQTLRASVDWSHALLTEPERVLFRRLAAFLGGFDFDAAQTVASGGEVERYQVLDQLTLLVDKSLVVADDSRGRTRYRLLETVRQYALEKLGESGEADAVRARHRDHYTAMAAVLDAPAGSDYEQRLEQADIEIDNLRAAFGWSRENSDIELALTLASSLQPLWQARGRIREGLAWFDTALADLDAQHPEVAAAVRARALADKAVLDTWAGAAASTDQAEQALAIARDVDDPALLARTLTACGFIAGAGYNAEVARACFAEAIGLARAVDDRWRLSQILALQAQGAEIAGDLLGMRAAGEEGRDLADAIGDRFNSRACRFYLGTSQTARGDLAGAAAQFGEVAAEAEEAHDEIYRVTSLGGQSLALAYQGEAAAARAAAEAALEGAAELGGRFAVVTHAAVGFAALAAGDVAAAHEAREAARQDMTVLSGGTAAVQRIWNAEAALADRDLAAARRWADEAVATTTGLWLAWALTARARVAIAEGEPEQAERDAQDALAGARRNRGVPVRPGHPRMPRRSGRRRRQSPRSRPPLRRGTAQSGNAWAQSASRSMTPTTTHRWRRCETPWATATLTPRGPRARRCPSRRRSPTRSAAAANANAPPAAGASLTPTELDVVRLVSEGLANNDIAARLFISPRTVQTHLTHVYTKLGLTSRVQLAQEAARHT